MNKNIRKEIAYLIKEDTFYWIKWYQSIIDDRLSLNLKTKQDKFEYLENCEPNNDYEELMFSQGYIVGLKTALKLLNENN
jgi:hypothetical protein